MYISIPGTDDKSSEKFSREENRNKVVQEFN